MLSQVLEHNLCETEPNPLIGILVKALEQRVGHNSWRDERVVRAISPGGRILQTMLEPFEHDKDAAILVPAAVDGDLLGEVIMVSLRELRSLASLVVDSRIVAVDERVEPAQV